MPRLLGLRETTPVTMYDAFGIRVEPGQHTNPRWRLFGNANIGDRSKTNLHVAGQLVNDETATITTWYARTNLHEIPGIGDGPYRSGCLRPAGVDQAYSEWAHASLVTLLIGNRPVVQSPLSELLDPGRRWSPGTGSFAVKLYEIHLANTLGGAEAAPWFELPSDTQKYWLSNARQISETSNFPTPVFVSPRQCFAVLVESDVRAYGRLMEIVPTLNIAPQLLTWVHLDGTIARNLQ